MAKNIYYSYKINDNRMFKEWVTIFKRKEEKSVDLLFEIVNSEYVDDEDLSIGCQAISVFIQENHLWVSELLLSKIIANIADNLNHIEEWFSLSTDSLKTESWVEKRRVVILECISEISTWPKVIKYDYDASIDLFNIIEKQLALGLNIQDILNYSFVSLKNIAKNKYGVHPNITIPIDFANKLENILVRLKEVERKGVEVSDIIKDVSLLLSMRKWLI
jgi:hypothetical protein